MSATTMTTNKKPATTSDVVAARATAAKVASPQAFDRKRALARARELLAPSLKGREAPAYPLYALGNLAPVADEIAEHGQMQPALAGQSLLGVASLLTQGLFNVRSLSGVRPLSLYLLTLGDSGDGKSTADGVAMASVKAWQRRAGEAYQSELRQHKAELRALKKGDTEPDEPRSPYRLVRDATVEGLRRDLEHGPTSQGLFTDEAAALLGGYGMSPEHKAKTAAAFSGLWDSGELSVSRSMGPRVELHGRRLAMHWLVQPTAAAEALSDPLLSALGFWPRFLLAWPSPCEPRQFRPFRPETLPAIGAYWDRCAQLLQEPLPGDAGKAPLIELDKGADAIVGDHFEAMELQGRRGPMRVVKPFALRAAEQTCRVAAVLAAFDGRATVTAEDALNAVDLVLHSLNTWRAVIDEGAADAAGAHALRLYEWLTDPKHCPGWKAEGRAILRTGPACVRSKDKRDAALDLLEAAGLVSIDAGTVYALDPASDPATHEGAAA